MTSGQNSGRLLRRRSGRNPSADAGARSAGHRRSAALREDLLEPEERGFAVLTGDVVHCAAVPDSVPQLSKLGEPAGERLLRTEADLEPLRTAGLSCVCGYQPLLLLRAYSASNVRGRLLVGVVAVIGLYVSRSYFGDAMRSVNALAPPR